MQYKKHNALHEVPGLYNIFVLH